MPPNVRRSRLDLRELTAAPEPPVGDSKRLYLQGGVWKSIDENGTIQTVGATEGGYVAGGTDVAVADGGTGASTAAGARTNLGAEAAGVAVAAVAAHEGAGNPHPAYATDSDLTAHAAAGDPHPAYRLESEPTYLVIQLDGGGAVVPNGTRPPIRVPWACTITKWQLVANAAGTITVDLWRDTYANHPPVVGDSITGGASPALSAAIKGEATVSWALAAGDYILPNVANAATLVWATLVLELTR